jgi:uncharacterized protein
MRQIPDDFDKAAVVEIDERLSSVSREHSVRVPLAIESGSRAWGFPSPDSDYDCRFVFVRRSDSYLTLFPRRDVIETPLTAVIDVNGWDVGKTIKLMLNGNAVAIEWLMSPIVYQSAAGFKDSLLELANRVVEPHRVARHYLHLAYSMRGRVSGGGEFVKLKKLFYVLRPCAALRFMRLHPGAPVAPMNFQTLLGSSDISDDLRAEIDVLLAAKAKASEMGEGLMPPLIQDFILEEIARAERVWHERPAVDADRLAAADDAFRMIIDRFGPA